MARWRFGARLGQESASFLKKEAKNFSAWRTWPGERVANFAKLFCFFSSEKKTLSSSYPSPSLNAAVTANRASAGSECDPVRFMIEAR
jgi:hypothetical protein